MHHTLVSLYLYEKAFLRRVTFSYENASHTCFLVFIFITVFRQNYFFVRKCITHVILFLYLVFLQWGSLTEGGGLEWLFGSLFFPFFISAVSQCSGHLPNVFFQRNVRKFVHKLKVSKHFSTQEFLLDLVIFSYKSLFQRSYMDFFPYENSTDIE